MCEGEGVKDLPKNEMHFYRVCHVGIIFWTFSDYLKVLKHRSSFARPKLFREPKHFKVHLILLHLAIF